MKKHFLIVIKKTFLSLSLHFQKQSIIKNNDFLKNKKINMFFNYKNLNISIFCNLFSFKYIYYVL